LLDGSAADEHAWVHLPRDPTGWVLVAAFFVAVAGLVILVAALVRNGSILPGVGLGTLGVLVGTVATVRMQIRGGPPR
jgi:hypothetical protein